MRKTILIFGAIDRFNYGDLLFPLIIVNKLNEIDSNIDYDYRFYGIIESDMSKLGAIPTKNIFEFYKDCNEIENATIIIAGGQVLNATWSVLLSFLYKRFSSFFLLYRKLFRGRFNELLNLIIQRYYTSPTKLPFVISKRNFKKVTKIIYNSVGGPNDRTQLIKWFQPYKVLLDSDYLSVRDKYTYELFNEIGFNVILNPDSAILMTELFSMDYISARITLKKEAYNNEYVFFQISKNSGILNINLIAEQLTLIHNKYKLKIVLCPIGVALGHEDQIPLSLLYEKLKNSSILIETPSIWDIMFLISKSKLYLGTSLHGIITAMSFSIPYIGLGEANSKLDSYLKSWAVPYLNRCISLDSIIHQVKVALSISNETLIENREYQIKLSNNSFKDIYNLILK